jgi:TM2 domain-containing membrane protein YozV
MPKVIHVTDSTVSIGLENGGLIDVARSDLSFLPTVGDYVEIFQGNGKTVVNKLSSEPTRTTSNPAGKSKLVAGLLGIFLGGLGIHNFYLGNAARGIAQIVVSLVTLGIGAIWGFIEGILILCSNVGSPWHKDANGVELNDN